MTLCNAVFLAIFMSRKDIFDHSFKNKLESLASDERRKFTRNVFNSNVMCVNEKLFWSIQNSSIPYTLRHQVLDNRSILTMT